ncbi:hypothetical protein CROQUDRAFT_89677 [Cronartium quercuum f. sp. fusiforme G11]|uniref:Uncharacterized protein n=1 Tax=Cronartium quercuum f. sp. fusiforme G11 TaxID=708437 RepID=A0A9P6NMX3_9BASI|nr:hypothetical protein CROQUDRAFT_89677 [Cronartium quercuum f. sp. fusiforme G11]
MRHLLTPNEEPDDPTKLYSYLPVTKPGQPSTYACGQHRQNQPVMSTATDYGSGPLPMLWTDRPLVNVNGSKFTVEVLPDLAITTDNDALPDGIWASEGNLMEAWDNPDEGADTGVSGNQGS